MGADAIQNPISILRYNVYFSLFNLILKMGSQCDQNRNRTLENWKAMRIERYLVQFDDAKYTISNPYAPLKKHIVRCKRTLFYFSQIFCASCRDYFGFVLFSVPVENLHCGVVHATYELRTPIFSATMNNI